MYEKFLKFLREQAGALEKQLPDVAKQWHAMAGELASVKVVEDTEAVIAARIKSGDLIPKSLHLETVASAEKAAQDKALKAIEEKAALEKKTVEVKASRQKALDDSGLDPKAVVGVGKTLESVTASFPVSDDGDKAFDSQLADWKEVSKVTGQFKKATASAGKGGAVATGGGSGGAAEKPAAAFC